VIIQNAGPAAPDRPRTIGLLNESARQWLETAIPSLENHRPLDLAATEPGAREVEDLIGRIEHGVVS
jgi:putative toxin-antitoxin system antitoxin component (TIGR02293 family)